MKNKFKNLVRKFCLDGSVNGFKYFYLYPDKISICFWTLNIITTLFVAVIITSLLYNRFSAMPTRITIENEYEPLTNLPYPAITLCSPNQITRNSMNHFNRTLVDGNHTLDLEDVLPQLLGYYHLQGHLNEDNLQHLHELININRYTVPEVMATLPQSCDNFLKLCFFEYKQYNKCHDLFRPILTEYGLCCIFNGLYYLKRRNQKDMEFTARMPKRSGVFGGALTVVADYEPDDAIDGTIISAGATMVMFNDWTEFPASDESYLIQSGSESFLAMHGTYSYCSDEVETLPQATRECYFETEQKQPFFGNYRNSDCDHICYVKKVEKHCHCIPFYMPHFPLHRTCNFTSIPCIMSVKMNMSEASDGIDCECPRDCVSRHYTAEKTFGNFAALPSMMIPFYKNLTFNSSSSILHFYFQSSVYTKVKQETIMSLSTFVSNIGGVFGLCLGCSLFSILEILFSIYRLLKSKLRELHLLRVQRCIIEYEKKIPIFEGKLQ